MNLWALGDETTRSLEWWPTEFCVALRAVFIELFLRTFNTGDFSWRFASVDRFTLGEVNFDSLLDFRAVAALLFGGEVCTAFWMTLWCTGVTPIGGTSGLIRDSGTGTILEAATRGLPCLDGWSETQSSEWKISTSEPFHAPYHSTAESPIWRWSHAPN